MRLHTSLIALSSLALLAACSRGDEGESAEDYAARMGGAQQAGVSGRDLNLPKVAEDGRNALSYAEAYVQTAADGTRQGLRSIATSTLRYPVKLFFLYRVSMGYPDSM